MSETTITFNIASFLPFWRYAVGPTSKSVPMIPFYTLSGAEMMFQKAQEKFPMFVVIMVKRCWGGVDLIRQHKGDPHLDKLANEISNS